VDGEVTALLEGGLSEGSALLVEVQGSAVVRGGEYVPLAVVCTYVCALERRGKLATPREFEHGVWLIGGEEGVWW